MNVTDACCRVLLGEKISLLFVTPLLFLLNSNTAITPLVTATLKVIYQGKIPLVHLKGISPDPEKKPIVEMNQPSDKKELLWFLGMLTHIQNLCQCYQQNKDATGPAEQRCALDPDNSPPVDI